MLQRIDFDTTPGEGRIINPAATPEAMSERNSEATWNQLWGAAETRDWRAEALQVVYQRIADLMPPESKIVDLGGGVGALAKKLADEGHTVEVWEKSSEARRLAAEQGLVTRDVDLEHGELPLAGGSNGGSLVDVVVSTEVLEHLSDEALDRVLTAAARVGKAMFSVPHNRLGPDEEPQHARKWTALEYRRHLKRYFKDVRVEVLPPFGPNGEGLFMMGVCGFPKAYTMSVTMPVRDEGKDLGRVLASFMAVADEIVIGIDPRTVDDTREVAARFADVIFDLVELRGPPGEEVEAEDGVHFSHLRNQCIDKCSGDWIFMSEGHEKLLRGVDTCLNLDSLVPECAKMVFVMRTADNQQWAFPWVFRKDSAYRFTRAVHNLLNHPPGAYVVRLPMIRTFHERDVDRARARAGQRKGQNRKTLLEDWMVRGCDTQVGGHEGYAEGVDGLAGGAAVNSLFYLGQEWRDTDPKRAIQRLEQFLALPHGHGPMRYQARLILAKILMGGTAEDRADAPLTYDRPSTKEARARAREVLMGATADDWCRTEHFLWLGDLSWEDGNYEEALQFYRYHGTMIGSEGPFTLWWIDLPTYGYVGAQRLAMAFSALGALEHALFWSRKVVELLPEGSPPSVIEECEKNITAIEEALQGEHHGQAA